MVVAFAPRPQEGRPSQVEIIDTAGVSYPLQVVEGSWQVQEAQRFGDKISVGPLSYQDFNPYESATVSARFHGGYGLRRYSDWTGQDDAYTHILESSNVDTAHDIAILSPQINSETLPNSSAPPVWIGEVGTPTAPVLTVVCGFAGRCIYQRLGGVWVQAAATTTAAPVQGAVGLFGGALILGYGGAAAAQYTLNAGATLATVTDDAGAPNSLFVYAVTTDHSAAYIAGGALNDLGTAFHGQAQVMASSNGTVYQRASIVKCGDPNWPITALAPGGGVATLYVAKTTELGQVDAANVYQVLIPFETRHGRNGTGMHWWMGRAQDEQRGPLALLIPRDGQLWMYAPSNQHAGQAQNLTPWANPDIRPPNVRGDTYATLGTARWLYQSIQSAAGHSWILRRDARTNATSVYLDLGFVACNALAYTTLVGNNPTLWMGSNNNLVYVVLPRSAEWALDDTNCRYSLTGTLDFPEIDLGFVAEPKIEFSVQVVADGLSGGQQIQVQYATDGGTAYTIMGTAQTSPVTEMLFPDPRPSVHTLQLRALFGTNDAQFTPQLRALVVRQSLNTKLYRLWVFQARSPAGATALGDDLINPYLFVRDLWTLRRDGLPLIFVDRWGDRAQVRILEMGEQESYREPDRVPETVVGLKLLEVTGAAALTTSLSFALGAWTGVWLPQTVPEAGPGPEWLTGTTTVPLTGARVIYPVWTFQGPGRIPRVTLTHTAPDSTVTVQTWELNHELLAGETITADFDPSHHTVLDQDGQDYAARVTVGSAFWAFTQGDNDVLIEMTGATTASEITMTRAI